MGTVSKSQKLPSKIYPHEKPVPFVENFKWPGANNTITFTADSFSRWVLESLPLIKGMKPMHYTKVRDKGMRVGDKFYFYLRSLPLFQMISPFAFCTPRPTRSRLAVYRRTISAFAAFDDVVNIPVLCDNLLHPWMSLTPNEIFTQRGQIRRAKGKTAMAGLGLGWAARKVLERKQVKSLTIYERDSAVIETFGASLVADFGDRVTIEQADAYLVDWQQYDVALWDIWKDYGDACDDRKFWGIKRAMESNGKVCEGWGQTVHSDHY